MTINFTLREKWWYTAFLERSGGKKDKEMFNNKRTNNDLLIKSLEAW